MKQKPAFIIVLLLFFAYSLSQLGKFIPHEALVFDRQNPPKILMLSTQDCAYCAKARDFFKQYQLPYRELDIEASDKNMQMFQLLGGQGTPLIIIEGVTIHGFDENGIRQAIKLNQQTTMK